MKLTDKIRTIKEDDLRVMNECSVVQGKTRSTKSYMTTSERLELINECGDTAYMLFSECYLMKHKMKYNNRSVRFTDEYNASQFGWSAGKAKKERLKLQRAGYLLRRRGTFTDGVKFEMTFIGKKAVEEYLSSLDNQTTLPIHSSNYSEMPEVHVTGAEPYVIGDANDSIEHLKNTLTEG